MQYRSVILYLFLVTSFVAADGIADLSALTTTTNANASSINALANSTDNADAISAAQAMIYTVTAQISTIQQSVTNLQVCS